jgi:hypothetical protein
MKYRDMAMMLVGIMGLTAPSVMMTQTLASSSVSDNIAAPVRGGNEAISSNAVTPLTSTPYEMYRRPTQTVMLHNYFYEAFGPFPIVASAFAAGISQASDSPPEWHEGAEGYGRRFGSNMGIVAIGTSTRYALAEATGDDTMYYRCSCSGFLARLGHAVAATLTARRGSDGHHVFSVPALVSPYAGTMTGVYAWFPDRYGAKDAFRMGNYVMLGYVGQNVSMEFFPNGHISLLSRLHLNNRRAGATTDTTQ